MRRVDAEVVLNELHHVVHEFQVLATRIWPPITKPLGCDENSAVVGQLLESKVRHVVTV